MKQFFIFVFLVCVSHEAYTQDLIKELQRLTLVNDSLQKAFKLEKGTLEQKIKVSNDSITQLIAVHKTETLSLNAMIRDLKSDTANLNKLIKKLDKKKIEKIEQQLYQKADSLLKLKNLLLDKEKHIITIKQESEKQIFAIKQEGENRVIAIKQESEQKVIAIKQEGEKKEQQKYIAGQQSVFHQIAIKYQSMSFNDLVNISSKASVERDLPLVGDNDAAKQKLQNLQKYFVAQSMLEYKYDAQNMQNALNHLNSITEKSELLDKLKTRIEDYKLCSDALKITIGKILKLDNNFNANDDYAQKTKLQDILVELAWYFRNYQFNFTDYPYLADIVLEIMTKKQRDANADMSVLFSKL
jgi:hypothetical protein